MRTLFRVSLALTLALPAAGFASTGSDRTSVPPIALRELQTRTFEGVDSHTAMKAAIDMLQDGGFSIERTDAGLGIVTGKRGVVRRPSAGKRALKYVGAAFSYGLIGLIPLNQTDELEASINITAIDDKNVRVRISLEQRQLDKHGRLKKSETLTQSEPYRDLFELLGRSLFITQEP